VSNLSLFQQETSDDQAAPPSVLKKAAVRIR
jgi:hypothetical protein